MTHTPESFRTAADFLASMHLHAAADTLRIEADKLERQADEDKRIDELARISFNAELEYAREENPSRSQLLGWSESTEFQRNIARAGIRAVLAKLDEEKAELKRINGGNGGWPTAFDNPETVSIILGGTE